MAAQEKQGKIPIPALPITICVYNMATQGKIPIPALPITEAQAKRFKMKAPSKEKKAASEQKKAASEQRKLARNEKKKALEKTRIYIGTAMEYWRRFKEAKELKSDAEVAFVLLDQ